jgi:hypothetical protein
MVERSPLAPGPTGAAAGDRPAVPGYEILEDRKEDAVPCSNGMSGRNARERQ